MNQDGQDQQDECGTDFQSVPGRRPEVCATNEVLVA